MIVARTVEIDLNNGQVASIDISEELLERVRTSFCLNSQDMVTERHLKYYLVSSMQNALRSSDVE